MLLPAVRSILYLSLFVANPADGSIKKYFPRFLKGVLLYCSYSAVDCCQRLYMRTYPNNLDNVDVASEITAIDFIGLNKHPMTAGFMCWKLIEPPPQNKIKLPFGQGFIEEVPEDDYMEDWMEEDDGYGHWMSGPWGMFCNELKEEFWYENFEYYNPNTKKMTETYQGLCIAKREFDRAVLREINLNRGIGDCLDAGPITPYKRTIRVWTTDTNNRRIPSRRLELKYSHGYSRIMTLKGETELVYHNADIGYQYKGCTEASTEQDIVLRVLVTYS